MKIFDKNDVETQSHFDDIPEEADGDPNVVLKELHEALGRELYVESRLRCRGGIKFSSLWHKTEFHGSGRAKFVRYSLERDAETFHIYLGVSGKYGMSAFW